MKARQVHRAAPGAEEGDEGQRRVERPPQNQQGREACNDRFRWNRRNNSQIRESFRFSLAYAHIPGSTKLSLRLKPHRDMMKAKELIKQVEKAGWRLDRVKGSHHIFKNPDYPETDVVIPFHTKDLGKDLVNSLLKKAGLK